MLPGLAGPCRGDPAGRRARRLRGYQLRQRQSAAARPLSVNVPGCSVGLYDHAPAPKYYLNLLGFSHLPPYTVPGVTRDHVSSTIIHFLGAYLHHRRGELTVMRWVGAVPGLMMLNSAASLGARGMVRPVAP